MNDTVPFAGTSFNSIMRRSLVVLRRARFFAKDLRQEFLHPAMGAHCLPCSSAFALRTHLRKA